MELANRRGSQQKHEDDNKIMFSKITVEAVFILMDSSL
jgi:hypothetical protein